MLRWRLSIGAALVAGLVALCWADSQSERPGAYFAPLALAATLLAAGEVLRMGRAHGVTASRWAVLLAALAPVAASCAPIWRSAPANLSQLGWLAAGLLAGLVVLLLVEMRKFEQPGATTAKLSLGALAVLYVGGLLGTLVQLRIVRHGAIPLGLTPLVSMIAAVKLSDTCQYFVGKSVGRTKLAPKLSPGKTWEGTVGGIGLAVVISAFTFPAITTSLGGVAASAWRWGVYAIVVAVVGLLGDLAESLLKRDAGVKDSSDWLPGFGGVLDLLDSLLLAAPAAYACWACGLLGPG